MGNGMTIEVSENGGDVPVTIFNIKGDIDAKTYEQLVQRAEEAYGSGTRNLVIDLSGVKFMSSAGLRAVNAIFTMLREQNPSEEGQTVAEGLRKGTYKSPHLKLVCPSSAVKRTLTMGGFDMFIDFYDDLQKAVNSF